MNLHLLPGIFRQYAWLLNLAGIHFANTPGFPQTRDVSCRAEGLPGFFD